MKSNKFVRGIFGLILSCFVIAVITSCTQPVGGYSPQINYLAAVDGVPDEFLGTWENNDWGHSEYAVSKNHINPIIRRLFLVRPPKINCRMVVS